VYRFSGSKCDKSKDLERFPLRLKPKALLELSEIWGRKVTLCDVSKMALLNPSPAIEVMVGSDTAQFGCPAEIAHMAFRNEAQGAH
jgi:hypothetical protein